MSCEQSAIGATEKTLRRLVTVIETGLTPPEERVPFVASENIPAFVQVTGNGFIGDTNNPAHTGKIIGFSTTSVLSGFPGTAQSIGPLTNPLWVWNAGDRIYVNGTTLSISRPITGYFSQCLGVATTTDTIDVLIKNAIRL